MKRLLVHTVITVGIIGYLTGCGRIIDWGTGQFNQGEHISYNLDHVRRFIRSIKIYDQMTTAGMFDALWLSDEVRTEYARIHAHKEGKDGDRTTTLLRRQLEENRHFISFYVLVPNYISLGDDLDDDWSVLLMVDGLVLYPTELKTVELGPEYQLFFCRRFNRFKTVYLVKFDAKDSEKNSVVTASTTSVKMCFRSVNKQAELTWHLDQGMLRDTSGNTYQKECTN